MASGDGCGDGEQIRVPTPLHSSEPRFNIGDRVPDEYQILTNTAYYGLPAPSDGWVYMRVEHRLFRVDLGTRQVVADTTHEANRAF
jgi:hypothetical protein